MKNPILLFSALIIPCYAWCQEVQLPWLDNVARQETIKSIHTIKTSAEVSVSDGSRYTASTIYHDPQRAIFHIKYPDRSRTYGVEGMLYWSCANDTLDEAEDGVRDYVLGHQMFAQILYFNKIHDEVGNGVPSKFNRKNALKFSAPDGWSFFIDKNNNPIGMTNSAYDFLITFTFSDFRNVQNVRLPFKIVIDDESRKFEYKFSSVLINEGTLDDFRPPLEKLTPEQQLWRLHRIAMDDHWFERADGIKAMQADSIIYISGGKVTIVSSEQSEKTLDRIMRSRFHFSYDDLIKPIIKISEDGTLGWVIARIQAKGVRLDENGKETEALDFICSWIMLYQKINGEWKWVGNSSTF